MPQDLTFAEALKKRVAANNSGEVLPGAPQESTTAADGFQGTPDGPNRFMAEQAVMGAQSVAERDRVAGSMKALSAALEGVKPKRIDDRLTMTKAEKDAELLDSVRSRMSTGERILGNVYNPMQSFTAGAMEMAASPVEAAGQIGEMVGLGGETLRGAAEAMRGSVAYDEAFTFNGQPLTEPGFGSELAGGAGSLAGFLVGGVAGKAVGLGAKATAAGLGALVEAQSMYREAEASGADDATKRNAFLFGAAIGTSEMFGSATALDRIDKASGGQIMRGVKLLIQGVKREGVEEFTQEAGQTLAESLVAQQILKYATPEDLETLLKGAGKGGLIGGLLGTGLHVVATPLTDRARKKATKKAALTIAEDSFLNLDAQEATRKPRESKTQTPEQVAASFKQGNIDEIQSRLDSIEGDTSEAVQAREKLTGDLEAVSGAEVRKLGDVVEDDAGSAAEDSLAATVTLLNDNGANLPEILVMDAGVNLPIQGVQGGGQIVLDSSRVEEVLRGVIFHEAFHHVAPKGSDALKEMVSTAREQFPVLTEALRRVYLARHGGLSTDMAGAGTEDQLTAEFEEAFALGAELMPKLVEAVLTDGSGLDLTELQGDASFMRKVRDFIAWALRKVSRGRINMSGARRREMEKMIRSLSEDVPEDAATPKEKLAFVEALKAAYAKGGDVAIQEAVAAVQEEQADVMAPEDVAFVFGVDVDALEAEVAVEEPLKKRTPRAKPKVVEATPKEAPKPKKADPRIAKLQKEAERLRRREANSLKHGNEERAKELGRKAAAVEREVQELEGVAPPSAPEQGGPVETHKPRRKPKAKPAPEVSDRFKKLREEIQKLKARAARALGRGQKERARELELKVEALEEKLAARENGPEQPERVASVEPEKVVSPEPKVDKAAAVKAQEPTKKLKGEELEDQVRVDTRRVGWSRLHLIRRVTSRIRAGAVTFPVTSGAVEMAIDGGPNDDLRQEVLEAIAESVNTHAEFPDVFGKAAPSPTVAEMPRTKPDMFGQTEERTLKRTEVGGDTAQQHGMFQEDTGAKGQSSLLDEQFQEPAAKPEPEPASPKAPKSEAEKRANRRKAARKRHEAKMDAVLHNEDSTFIHWARANGGIQNDGGELTPYTRKENPEMGKGLPPGFPQLVQSKGKGIPPDMLVREMFDAGWFGEDASGDVRELEDRLYQTENPIDTILDFIDRNPTRAGASAEDLAEPSADQDQAQRDEGIQELADDMGWTFAEAKEAFDHRYSVEAQADEALKGRGFTVERRKGGSTYYQRRDVQVRVSDHEVPLTAEREHNAQQGGQSWATGGWNLVLGEDSTPEDVTEFMDRLDAEHPPTSEESPASRRAAKRVVRAAKKAGINDLYLPHGALWYSGVQKKLSRANSWRDYLPGTAQYDALKAALSDTPRWSVAPREDTPEFKAMVAKASPKVKYADGKPIPMFHGTRSDLDSSETELDRDLAWSEYDLPKLQGKVRWAERQLAESVARKDNAGIRASLEGDVADIEERLARMRADTSGIDYAFDVVELKLRRAERELEKLDSIVPLDRHYLDRTLSDLNAKKAEIENLRASGAHGPIKAFETLRYGATDGGYVAAGTSFTPDPELASEYAMYQAGDGKNVVPVYLFMENPYERGDSESVDSEYASRMAAFKSYDRRAIALEVRRVLEGMGFDGVVTRGGTDGLNGNPADEFTAFNTNQIKSIWNRRPTSSPDMRKSIPSPDPNETIVLSSSWGVNVEEVMADNLLKLRNVQATLNVPEGADWDREDVRSSGILMAAVDDFQEEFVDPLVKALSAGDITIEDAHRYLAALHSLERNETLMGRDAKLQKAWDAYEERKREIADWSKQKTLWDRWNKDKADGKNLRRERPKNPGRKPAAIKKPKSKPKGFSKEKNPGGWLRESEAKAIIKDALSGEKGKHFRKLRRLNRAMHEAKLRLIEEHELEPPEVIAKTRALGWKDYVPMKTLLRGMPGIKRPKGASVTGRTVNRMGGRRTEPDNVLIAGVMDFVSVLQRVEKNRVMTTFANLVEVNPDPTLWEIVQGSLSEVKMTSQDEIEAGEEPNIYRALWDARIPVGDSAIGFMRGGKQEYIVLHPRGKHLADALTGANLLTLGRILHPFSAVNRYYAQANTSWTLNFPIDNFRRDLFMGVSRIAAEDGGKMAAKTVKGIPSALRALQRGTGSYSEFVDDYIRSGAKTGHMWSGNFDSELKAINKKLKRASAPTNVADRTGRVFGAVADIMAKYNDTIENGIRFSYWLELVRSGMSHADAAVKTKELTINFNKRGRIMPLLGPLYLFAGAGTRGTVAVKDMIKANPKKLLGSTIALGVFLDLLNYYASPDDDDGENAWDSRREFEKDRYMMVPDGNGGFYKVWTAPYGLSVFITMGRKASEVMRGKSSVGEAMSATLASAINSFNPIGGGDGDDASKVLGHMISPTLTDPIMDVGMNDDFAGRPIYSDYGDGIKADSSMARKHTPETWKSIAEGMNAATGGDRLKSGLADFHPETIRHLWKNIGGGVWRDGTHAADAMSLFMKGEYVRAFDMAPITSRFHTSEYEGKFMSTYYTNTRAIDTAATRVDAEDITDTTPMEEALADLDRSRKKIVRYVTKMNRLIDEEPDESKAEGLYDEMKDGVREFNREVSGVRKEVRDE